MGLDITAYSELTKLDCVFNADLEPIDPVTREEIDCDSYTQVFINHNYPERCQDLEDKAIYTYSKATGFRAGSYGGYNQWREKLAELAGYPLSSYNQYGKDWPSHAASAWEVTEGPFWEIINFSDCEGTIGPKVSQKLAKDFQEFQEKANTFQDDYWRQKYSEWREAFEMASHNGAVSFH